MAETGVPKHMRNEEYTEASPPSALVDDADLGDPPPYFEYSDWKTEGSGLRSSAHVEQDGRIVVSLDFNERLPDLPEDFAPKVDEFGVDAGNWTAVPPLNIVIMIVGSRGDVQPYVAVGKRLKRDRHRVRIASHATFRTFVEEHGLEFFDIGGNPHDLMAYMVRNPGLIPGISSLTNGDILKKRAMLTEMMNGCWNACHSPDQQTGRTFLADAIISNPPAFAHVHCAEALGIPLQMSFTMPWCATGSFPHPLVNVKSTNAEKRLTNYLSYALADTMTWQGIGDIVNKLRRNMGLSPLTLRNGPDILDRLKVPWTYCMSPALVPKPSDWSNHIDVVGFYFLDLAKSYTPPPELAAFLAAGPAPVYIGFGSVVVDDPAEMTRTIFEATKNAGVRALVSAGWSELGTVSVPSHIFILGNVPHDWLFAEGRVRAVVHHGGAGTTAIGLAKGCPTVVVPFFGDQQFWGDMIARAGAGPKPIPQKSFDVPRLTEAIQYAVSPQAREAAARIAESIANENGVPVGVDSFYRHLPLLNMRCDLDPERVAVWWSTKHCMKLSAFAAQVLLDNHKITLNQIDLHRSKEYDAHIRFKSPLAAGVSSLFWMLADKVPFKGIPEVLRTPPKGIIHTMTAIPRGMTKLYINFNEGLHNLPALYGGKIYDATPIREPVQQTVPMQNPVEISAPEPVSSAPVASAEQKDKGIFHSLYKNVAGRVTQPLHDAKDKLYDAKDKLYDAKDGIIDGLKTGSRRAVDRSFRPISSKVGLVGLHMRDLYRQVRIKRGDDNANELHGIRISQGIEDVQASTEEQRKLILSRFKAADTKGQLAERRRLMFLAAKRELERQLWTKTESRHGHSPATRDANSGSASSKSDASHTEPSSQPSGSSKLNDPHSSMTTSSSEQESISRDDVKDETQFRRALERTFTLSRVEKTASGALEDPKSRPETPVNDAEEDQAALQRDLDIVMQLTTAHRPDSHS